MKKMMILALMFFSICLPGLSIAGIDYSEAEVCMELDEEDFKGCVDEVRDGLSSECMMELAEQAGDIDAGLYLSPDCQAQFEQFMSDLGICCSGYLQ